jgi:uncharacterized protein YciI
MPHFVITAVDRPNALEKRMAVREAHLAYARESGLVRVGGPFLDEAGNMAGSMLIIEAEDLAAAKAFSAADPYFTEGVFETVDVRPFKVTLGSL